MDKEILQIYEQIRVIIDEESDRGQDSEWRKLSIEEIRTEIEENEKKVEELDYKLKILFSLYQNKYGIPEKLWWGEISIDDVINAEQFLESERIHPVVFNLSPGLFSKRVKKSEYEDAAVRIQMLHEFYMNMLHEQKKFEESYNSIDQLIEEYQKRVLCIKRNITSYREGQRTNGDGINKSPHIYIGDISTPLNLGPESDQRLKKLYSCLKKYELVDEHGGWVDLPFSYSTREPFLLFIDHSYAEEAVIGKYDRLGPKDLVHGIMYQIIHAMPVYTYSFNYLDTTGAGKNLEELQKLSTIVNGNAYWLKEEIFNDTFRLLEKAEGQSSVKTMLRELGEYVSRINQIRCDEDIISYNTRQMLEDDTFKDGAEIIPQKYIIFENIHGNLSGEDLKSVQMLIRNAAECGLSFIFLSEHEKKEPLDEYEQKIAGESNVDILEWHSEPDIDWHTFRVCGNELSKQDNGKYQYIFEPYGEKNAYTEYLDSFCGKFKPNLDVEVRFDKLFDLDREWGKYQGDDGIEFPIGVDSRGRVRMVRAGDSNGAHVLLTGATGCGKSSLLHTIINGIIMRYRPDDVQIWLSDYKSNEFRRYMEDTPAHIKYVATDRSQEYSLHFLDKIYAEYQRRIDLFGSITSVKEYRSVHGQGSMPRILIIVDEFHVMSNHIKEEPAYKSKLASILREARSVGVTLFLSDQTCGVGLQGLPEDGKKQLTCRLAMMTQTDEYNAVFNISNSKDVIPTVQPYEIVLQRVRLQKDVNGKAENRTYYEHDKTIFTDNTIRNRIAEKSTDTYGPASDTEFFVSEKRSKFDWNHIVGEQGTQAQRRAIPLYLGTPADLKKIMAVSLTPSYGENLMSIGTNLALQSDIIYYAVESIRRGNDSYRIFIMAEEYDLLFTQCEKYLEDLSAADDKIQLVCKEDEICRTIQFLLEELTDRRRKRSQEDRIFVFWLGLDELSRELAHYSEQRPKRMQNKNNRSMSSSKDQDRLDKLFSELFADTMSEKPYNGETEVPSLMDDDMEDCGDIYNANGDISELMKEGTKKSIHNLVFFTNVAAIKRARCISRIYGEEFRHKIAFRMSRDDAAEYMGRSTLILTPGGELLDEETAVYYDGLIERRFSPFKGPLEEGNE